MNKDAVISIQQLEKKYGNTTVLRVDQLLIQRNDRILVLGGNGSGKSTLLRILAGFTRVATGRVMRCSEWKEMAIGYLPQEGGVYRDLTIRENLAARTRAVGRSDDAESLAAQLGLLEILDRRVENLSGGFRRLAALYCLLASKTDVLLLDEPFASIDAEKRDVIGAALRSSASKTGLIVMTEHISYQLEDSGFWKTVKLGGQASAASTQK